MGHGGTMVGAGKQTWLSLRVGASAESVWRSVVGIWHAANCGAGDSAGGECLRKFPLFQGRSGLKNWPEQVQAWRHLGNLAGSARFGTFRR